MKRAPIVLTSTALGLVGVLTYHTAQPSSPGLTAGASSATTSTHTTTQTTTQSTTTQARTSTTPTTTTRPATRSAVGEDVAFQYGDIQVKVTETGHRITGVTLSRLSEPDPRSQSIDAVALPQLAQQAVSAQSAKIDGVSGASYTSQAYAQSLQSALDKLP